jgi:hypothetical protein
MSFEEFSKISRLSRPIVITEKLDGSNGQLYIQTCAEFEAEEPSALLSSYDGHIMYDDSFVMRVGSRKRWLGVSKSEDHFGFCKWAESHFAELCLDLGPGRHYGEWWGQGIQRKYGLDEKRFSLFNTHRWKPDTKPECCHVVPILGSSSVFDTRTIDFIFEALRGGGSHAAPGFMKPEGVVIYHPHGNVLMKKTFEGDEEYVPGKKRAD